MRIVICGAGQVGFGIAEKLAQEENDVSVIDTSARLVNIIRDTLDVRGVVGYGSHPDVLAQAGAEDADMLIAVTQADEVNMVACQVAHTLFNVPTKIARIRAQSYLQPHYQDLFARDHLPIDVIISPEIEVGETVLRRLSLPGAVETVMFADGTVFVVGILCTEDCPVIDTPLRQLTELFPDLGAVVTGVFRNGRLFVPQSDDTIVVGDLVYVVAQLDQVRRTVILHGSSLDQDILLEADIQDADVLVAVTNDDQANIIAGVMAKTLGCKRNLSLINNASYPAFAHALGIDAYVNPRAVTISRVLRHVRRGRIRSVHSLQNGAAEVIEAEALETSSLVGKPLRDLNLPEGIRIGAIYRRKQAITPQGDTQILAHDRVVIFALAEQVRQVEQMFRVSLEFF